MSDTITIQNTVLHLAQPDELTVQWIGNDLVEEQLIASWLVIDDSDVPLTPRLIGNPGVGKTTLAYHVAKSSGKKVYMMQCTMDTRPEDLLVTPVLGENGGISYHASPLVTAMITGGVCILDEGNRMSEKSWASLAPLLDARRYVESIIAGIKIKAERDFRLCVTMNDDASTYEIPEYIQSRLKPQIEVTFPCRDEEIKILSYNVPLASEKLLQYVADFLQKAHSINLPFSSRDGVHILRYILKMSHLKKAAPEGYLAEGIEAILGDDGREFLEGGVPGNRMRGAIRDENEDLFFDDDDSDF
ncbi:MAG: AAA family ATPase [Sumerlaeia bacterium]